MSCLSSPGSQSDSQATTRTDAQTDAINAGIGEVPSSFPGYGSYLGQGMDVYGGDRVAGMTSTGYDVLSQLPSFASMFGDLSGSPLQQQLESTSGSLLAGEMGAQPITPEQESAYFSSAIQDPRMKQFTETELPGIQEAYAGPGYWGNARANEVGEAYGDVGDWLGSQRAQLAWDTLGQNQAIEEAQANRALGAMDGAIAVGQAPTQEALAQLSGLGQTMQLADTERVQQQMEIDAAMQTFFEENQITDPQVMQAFAMLIGQNVGLSTTDSDQWGAGLGYTALSSMGSSLGSAIGSGAAAAMSDIRAKENISKANLSPMDIVNKLEPHTYNYKGNPEKKLGFIAQDIEKIYPIAVTEINGIKHVDLYAMQTLMFACMKEMMEVNNAGTK